MKLILLKTIKNVGNQFEIVEVNYNYAKNVLLKNNTAIIYNKNNLLKIEKIKENEVKKFNKSFLEEKEKLEKFKNLSLVFFLNGKNDKLFKTITNKKIINKIFELTKIKLNKKNIFYNHKFDSFGEYKILIKLMYNLKINILITIKRKINDR